MGAVSAILGNDARSVLRDRTVGSNLVLPFVFAALLRFGLPLLERWAPTSLDIVMLSLFSGVASLFPAFMLSMLMLDEKDRRLDEVYRVLPIHRARLLLTRLAPVAGLAVINVFLVVVLSGLTTPPPLQFAGLLFACAVAGPVTALVVVSVAESKIAGLAAFKAFFFLQAVAAVAPMVTGFWHDILYLIPPFWTQSMLSPHPPLPYPVCLSLSLAGNLLMLAIVTAGRRKERR